jgi:hypothetical protein
MEAQYRDTLPNDVRSAFDKAIEALPQEASALNLSWNCRNSLPKNVY